MLANTLGCRPSDLSSVLTLGIQEGLVGTTAPGWEDNPDDFAGYYRITSMGKQRYAQILDQFAQQIAGPPGLSIPVRFLLACAERQPEYVQRKLADLADNDELQRGSDDVERERAAELAAAALGDWALAALVSQHADAEAAGLSSLNLVSAELLGPAALLARGQYAAAVSGDFRVVVQEAASVAENAWDLRPISAPNAVGVSQERGFDQAAAVEAANAAAEALKAAARCGLFNLVEAARGATDKMRRRVLSTERQPQTFN